MITREQAEVANYKALGVFDPEGTEVTILALAKSFDSAIVEYNSGERNAFRLDELSPSRELLRDLEG